MVRITLLFAAGLLVVAAGCKKNDDPAPAPTPPAPPAQGVVDIDGNYYDTLTIGGNTWFTQNLRVRRFRNGDSIPYATTNAEWAQTPADAQCCAYENEPAFAATHGLLYSLPAMQDPRGACPEGWHPATDADWKQLEGHLGMPTSQLDSLTTPGPYGAWRGTIENVGGRLKSTGTWAAPNTGANNSSGFNALPSGRRNYQGHFSGLGEVASFWANQPAAWCRMLTHQEQGVFRFHNGMGSDQPGYGHSCRCVKD